MVTLEPMEAEEADIVPHQFGVVSWCDEIMAAAGRTLGNLRCRPFVCLRDAIGPLSAVAKESRSASVGRLPWIWAMPSS